MKRSFTIALVAALGLQIAAAQNQKPITAQAERGRELFLKSQKGIACGTCHTMAGVGAAVGPDLTKMASAVGPRGIVMTIRMTLTAYVQEVKTASSAFPGILKQKQGDAIEIWDLSQTPPVLRRLASSDVISMRGNEKWKHPPAAAGYTDQELADIIGFLKWAATGSQQEIKVADLK